MKMISISFNAVPRLPGVRPGDLITIDCARPSEALKNWRVQIRGQQVFLISPPGWVRDQNIKARDPKGPVTVFEISRADVAFQWEAPTPEALEAVLKGGKYESEPFGFSPAPVAPDKSILSQVPAGQVGDA